MPQRICLLLTCPENCRARALWVWRTWQVQFNAHVLVVDTPDDLPGDEPLVVYGEPLRTRRRCLVIPYDPVTWADTPDVTTLRWIDHEGEPLADPWGTAGTPSAERLSDGTTRLEMDLIGAACRVLSGDGNEESRGDAHGRQPHDESLIGRLGLTHQLVVDRWLAAIAGAVSRLLGRPVERRRLWGAAPFAFCATHDIDRIHKGWADALRRSVRQALLARWREGLQTATRALWGLRSGTDLYWNLDELLRLDLTYGARPTFFLMAGGGHELDAIYDLAERRWLPVVRRILESGGEVGLHGSYRSPFDRQRLAAERAALERLTGRPAAGVRQHFLRHDPWRTWAAQSGAGFAYDSTVGFVEHVGFRAGTCFPYPAFDLAGDRPLPMIELPLMVMDRTLEQYLRLSPSRAWEAIEPVLESVERHGGCLTALWHNLFVVEACYPGWQGVYERLLDWARQRGALMATGAEIHHAVRSTVRDN